VTDDHSLKPAPPPRQVDTARIVRFGIVLFAIATVVLLALPWSRDNPDNRVWLWTAIAGVVLGFAGLAIMRWQRAPSSDSSHAAAHRKK